MLKKAGLGFICLTLIALLALPLPALAGDKKLPPKGTDVKIWKQVKKALDKGYLLKACKLAVKMKPWAENPTPSYKKVQKALQKRGISIEDPMTSYTAKQIVRVQNKIEKTLVATGDLKGIGMHKNIRDAWGTPIRVEMAEIGDYLYLVRSAGPDKKWMTDDDPLIGGLKPKSTRPSQLGKGKGDKKAAAEAAKKKRHSRMKAGLMGTDKKRSGGGGGGPADPEQEAPAEENDPDVEALKEDLAELEKLSE